MAENLSEQLDQALAVMLANVDARPPVAAEVAPLLELARDLHDLPREAFRIRLKDQLMRSLPMVSESAAAPTANLIREGFHTVTPYLAVRPVRELIEFVKEAFDAEGAIYGVGSEGGLHSEYRIGDSIVMIGGGGPQWKGTEQITALHVYVDDVDETYRRAVAAGAESMMGPIEAHGERVASVRDIAGNEWYIAKRLTGSHTDEGLHNVNIYLHPVGAADMIEFLKRSFGAEEIVAYRETPGGPVVHAKIKIGTSVLEMGEAHGPFQTLPSMLYLYVDDVDAWHRRALAGGATEQQEPKDQPYGDRVSAVTDPFGNTWYLATHISDVVE